MEKKYLIGYMYGDQEIKNKVKELSIEDSVIFTGIREDIGSLLSAFDIFVFPSLFEGLGIVLIEAQTNGLPVIINTSIPKEAIISDNVSILSIDSIDEWVEEIEKKPGERTDNIDYEKFDVSKTSKLILSIYDDVVKKGINNG